MTRNASRKSGGSSLALALLLVGLAACGGSSDSTAGGVGGLVGDGQNGGGDDVGAGKIVAAIQLDAPSESSFTLRATIPLPPGTWRPDLDSRAPLVVLGPKNRSLISQCNVVTLYPAQEDGAAVVEVMAAVNRPARTAPGTAMLFQVAHRPFKEGEMTFDASVRDLLATTGGLRLVTHDVFGNEYDADLFAKVLSKDPGARKNRSGQLVHGYVTHEVLAPTDPKSGSKGTLPHLMGVHSYITTYHRQGFFSLDLHIHNGMDGLDKNIAEDDALNDIYFDALDLVLPAGWNVATFQPSPTQGSQTAESDGTHYPIIAERADSTLHVMPQQARLVRRMVVYKDSAKSAALATLNQETQAFCVAGQSPAGAEYWSWWNGSTSRFLGQAKRLPDLSFLGLNTLRQNLKSDYNQRRAQVSSGSTGGYPVQSAAIGWAHPWGVSYGGMTGGDEINIFEGLRTTATASREGYALAMLTSRCYIDRQPTALYDLNGDPTRVEDILVQPASGAPYANATYYLRLTGSKDPFGFDSAPTFQTTAVQAAGLTPDYEATLKNWMPIDIQHYIRFTRTLKTLAWVGNDPLAKDQLLAAAEIFRLGYHEYTNSSGGYVQGTGLRSKMDYVAAFPGQGINFQRGEGWGIDTAVAAYAMGDTTTRTRLYPWFQKIAGTVEAGQSTCSGNIMASYIGKTLGGQTFIRMVEHSSFADNALEGMRNSVFGKRDKGLRRRLDAMILNNAYAQVSPGFWDDVSGQPFAWIGVGPVGAPEDFCDDIPEWAQSPYTQTSYYSSLAYAYELSGDPVFLYRAAQMLGGGDLRTLLEGQGETQLELSAGLLAMLQDMPSQ